jgi:hypothetical protein
MAITNTALTTTTANVYASNGQNAITVIYVCNYSTSANAVFSIYAVPSGGTANSSSIIYSNVFVQYGDTYVIDSERLLLDNAQTLKMKVNANAVCTATVSYTNIS